MSKKNEKVRQDADGVLHRDLSAESVAEADATVEKEKLGAHAFGAALSVQGTRVTRFAAAILAATVISWLSSGLLTGSNITGPMHAVVVGVVFVVVIALSIWLLFFANIKK